MNDKYLDASHFIGKTITEIKKIDEFGDEIQFKTSDGKEYRMFHSQDCCESVGIHSIKGDLRDLIGSPITSAHESSTKEDWPDDVEKPQYDESFTWTTYVFTVGDKKVEIVWLGTSNGYYSETIQIDEME